MGSSAKEKDTEREKVDEKRERLEMKAERLFERLGKNDGNI